MSVIFTFPVLTTSQKQSPRLKTERPRERERERDRCVWLPRKTGDLSSHCKGYFKVSTFALQLFVVLTNRGD
ncbi:hypothetical protein LOK49_LG13G00877 [Camellia lanceoleosa]|uniref:Uncharacterized protein n=1 Tax=Camellia lanceoleosa TaxID=1840588 RepID=A0ACC0FHM4_9ERIC|nr:hypothetical protein LOK49_LG13G00877 [Camellia lanceoleosa]